MKGNGWQITAILSVITVIGLTVILCILLFKDKGVRERYAEKEQAVKDHAAAVGNLVGKYDEFKDLLVMIAGKESAAVKETAAIIIRHGAEAETELKTKMIDLEKRKTEIVKTADIGDDAASYKNTIEKLSNNLAEKRQAHRKIAEDMAKTEKDIKNAKATFEALCNSIIDQIKTIEEKRKTAQTKFDTDSKGRIKLLKESQDKQQAAQTKADREQDQYEGEIQGLAKQNKEISETNVSLTSQLDAVLNPDLSKPAGKILSIDQRSRKAVVNVGSRDGLMLRTIFSIYDPSAKGMTQQSATAEEHLLCAICKREVSLHLSKATAEVIRLLGPHQAEVKILDDILIDPVVQGDLIYSPIWKPGQFQRFVLPAGLEIPGIPAQDTVRTLKNLIETNGGIVDCWIDENTDNKEQFVQGAITEHTSFIVRNDRGGREINKPELKNVQDAVLEQVKNRAVREVRLTDLLTRFGWREYPPEADSSGDPAETFRKRSPH
ncbi:MAG: hypothetical protein LBH00_06525 [Planctomycetaceae bacterium]|jgi:hypothetical protein|nr:hypothetical protein [Planctomycetaceae bacterium]